MDKNNLNDRRQILLTNKDEYLEYTNDLTREMDTYLGYKKGLARTYIYDTKFEDCYAIRYPGATRGHIRVNDNDIITEIILYRDKYNTDKIYKENVRECFKKYIGMKLVMEGTNIYDRNK